MAICCSCIATWVVGAGILYFLWKKFIAGNKRVKLKKQDWKRDVVYLFQFNRPPKMANFSPFCVKVETFLRVNNIPYENIFTTTGRSEHGLLPFIELNGVQTGDSQLIIELLKEKFEIKFAPSTQEEGVARAVERMVDGNTCGVFNYYKTKKETLFFEGLLYSMDFPLKEHLLPFILYARPLVMMKVNKKIRDAVGGIFSEDIFHQLLKKDLDALANLLGEKKFLFGDKIYPADCAVFSHLATICYLEHPNEVKRIVAAEYPTIQKYHERIVDQVFPAEFS